MRSNNVIVIGGGLAGLSCATELIDHGFHIKLFEAHEYLGGRTASWNDNGMKVESGLHRYLGFYSEMPRLLKKVGLNLDDLFYWEDEIIIMLKGGNSGTFGLAPLFNPSKTLKTVFGNKNIFTLRDKLHIAGLMSSGIFDCITRRALMDTMTIRDYAKRHGMSDKLLTRIITPLSAGLFFLPPDRYSAFVFFGLFVPFLHRSFKSRVGAFRGGMTDIMAKPIGDHIIKNGGQIFTSSPVQKLLVKANKIIGVQVNDEEHTADHVVLATSLHPAQSLLKEAFHDHPWFIPMLALKTMPSVTIQIELNERSMKEDRTTFAPETCLASFSEQSESTFRHVAGRLSIILSPPEVFSEMPKELILERVCRDLDSINIPIRNKIKDYRIVIEPREFYALVPGAEARKPGQETPIPGLSLAGDYTRQRYLATMEGAVYSGRLAARSIFRKVRHRQ